MANPREKFQALLRKLFQFDCAELDFGIYRIMNQKRDVINKFIEKDLLDGVAMELTTGALAQESGLAQQLAEVSAQIKENFGDEALDAEGNLAKEYQTTPRGKQYLELRERASSARSSTELETEIFNHLYDFFSRYYDEGDFMSLRRYSKRDKYAIPYNGEEVHLHWANADQYYIKTGENFTDYSYKQGGWTVCFKLRNANVEQNNVKGAKRFFLPRIDDVELDKKANVLTVPFEYRPLSGDEETRYGSKPQEKILAEAYPKILAMGKVHQDALAALMHEKRKDAEGKPVTLLEHHLWTYARKNSSDFFIHKDLKGFLERELDFYLKNEVLNIDEIEAGGEARSPRWFQTMTTIKAIGRKIIVFLAQIEDFQKRIFEKKKFVTEVNYCITLDRVPEELYSEIIKNKAQLEEWKRLFYIHEIKREGKSAAYSEPLKLDFLKEHKYLVLDTGFFPDSFKERLIQSIENLDDLIDGVLLKSDNYQALRVLGQLLRGRVSCVYIDPPYNSKTSEILYKNTYKHSSWATLMANRLLLSKEMCTADGSHVVAIDENEQEVLGFIMRSIFPDHNRTCVAVVHNKKGIQGDHFSYSHEYAYFSIPQGLKYTNEKPIPENEWEWDNLRKWGNESERDTAKNCFYPIFVKDGSIIGFGDVCEESFHPKKNNVSQKDGVVVIYPVDSEGVERKWRYARDSVDGIKNILKVHRTQSGELQILKAKNSRQFKTIWDDSIYIAGDNGTRVLSDMGLKPDDNLFPKSIFTVMDSIHAVSNASALVLDYFGGSGTTAHAVIKLNRDDKGAGKRKYVLIEVGDYFDTVLKPRVQKVIYSDGWKEGKPVSRKGSSHAFKYMRLESYEDALDNISFQSPDNQDMFKLDDYVLSYMLDFETRQSETLLNVAKLDTPFDYKLKRHGKDKALPVDLPETFNYLIGLHVDSRRVLENKDNRYLVYRGKAEDRQTVIIWRTTSGWGQKEFEQDRDFVLKEKLTDGAEDVFVNADSFISGARSLDPVFKHRMFNEE